MPEESLCILNIDLSCCSFMLSHNNFKEMFWALLTICPFKKNKGGKISQGASPAFIHECVWMPDNWPNNHIAPEVSLLHNLHLDSPAPPPRTLKKMSYLNCRSSKRIHACICAHTHVWICRVQRLVSPTWWCIFDLISSQGAISLHPVLLVREETRYNTERASAREY